MTDDSLFADPRPNQPRLRTADANKIAEWQIAALRRALDEAGILTMEQRGELVRRLAGRNVAALRDLTIVEARAVAEGLIDRRGSSNAGGDWADREGETWIDRL